MSEQLEERASIEAALEAWERKGPTSLNVALVVDALYGARERLAAVEALADEWWGYATEAHPEPTWRGVCHDLRAALFSNPAEDCPNGCGWVNQWRDSGDRGRAADAHAATCGLGCGPK